VQIPRGCAPSSLLSVSVSLWRSKFLALCFHILTNCFSRLPAGLLAGKPFILTTIRIASGRGSNSRTASVLSLCALCLCGKSICFIRLRTLCRLEKSHLPWNQELPDSFAKTPGVGGYPFTTKLVSRSRSPWSSQAKRRQRAALFAESRAVATFQFRNHYLPEAALC